jgi:hypothetical protein
MQNLERQAGYAGYMFDLVCYLLPLITDKERSAVSYSGDESGSDVSSADKSGTGSATESDKGFEATGNKEDGRKRRLRHKLDLFKDACELSPWQHDEK